MRSRKEGKRELPSNPLFFSGEVGTATIFHLNGCSVVGSQSKTNVERSKLSILTTHR